LDAARGQLLTAIRLWFEGGDPVSIHSLASAAHEIVHALYRQKGLKGLIFDTPHIEAEHRQKWSSFLKKPFNFFKHGHNEPSDAEIEFDPIWSEALMMACCKGLTNLGVPIEGEELALTYWIFFSNPGVFGANHRLLKFPQIQFLQQLAAKGREVYFREFMAGYRAGTINFRDTRVGMGSETSPENIP
jgi:hypothetical protein